MDAVAVHRAAVKLLLPLDNDLFAIVCHMMLPDSVMQFDVGAGSTAASACVHDDAAKQELWFDFASSLTSEHYARALPFSPRIHLPLPAPLLQLDMSGSAVALDEDHTLSPANCNFPFWREHRVVACCDQHNVTCGTYCVR